MGNEDPFKGYREGLWVVAILELAFLVALVVLSVNPSDFDPLLDVIRVALMLGMSLLPFSLRWLQGASQKRDVAERVEELVENLLERYSEARQTGSNGSEGPHKYAPEATQHPPSGGHR